MTPEQFCYWLQGFTELRVGSAGPTDAQWAAIAAHLQTVFKKVTPPTYDAGAIPSQKPPSFVC